jgi:hypothetical protein
MLVNCVYVEVIVGSFLCQNQVLYTANYLHLLHSRSKRRLPMQRCYTNGSLSHISAVSTPLFQGSDSYPSCHPNSRPFELGLGRGY